MKKSTRNWRMLATSTMAMALLLGVGASAPTMAQQAAAPQRLQISQLVGYSDFHDATLSADGRYIAGILSDTNGDRLIVHDRQTRQTQPIQLARRDQNLEITFVSFKGNDRLVFGLRQKYDVVQGTGGARRANREERDQGHRFVSRVYATDVNGQNLISLYDPAGSQGFPREISAALVSILASDPNNVLMAWPTTAGTELRRVNVHSGASVMVDRGTYKTVSWVLDNALNPVLREEVISGGRGTAWYRRGVGGREWTEIARFMGDRAANGAPEFSGVGPGRTPGEVVVSARPDNRDTNGLYYYNTASGQIVAPLYENDSYDTFSVVRLPNTDTIVGSCYYAYKYECHFDDEVLAARWRSVEQAVGADNQVSIASGGDLSHNILVRVTGPHNLGAYYVYNTQTGALDLFQRERRTVRPEQLPSQQVFHYKAADGTDLWGYLWLPPGATMETRNLPMVVVPHGGPESRDRWGFDPFATYWSAQGYAVFQPNFRGGSGFGRRFVEAGWGQWGRLIQSDIREGTKAVTASGIADANRVCVAGWSHGGYVAFTASFMDGDIYKCSLAGAGVSDLRGMMAWTREEEGGMNGTSYRYWSRAIGDPSQTAVLDANSAFRNVNRINMPLFIVHGEKDETVPVEQGQIMIDAMERAHKPFRQLIIPGMDHYWRPDQAAGWTQVLTQGVEFFQANIGPGWTPPAPPAPPAQ